jgi:hypothetical protein
VDNAVDLWGTGAAVGQSVCIIAGLAWLRGCMKQIQQEENSSLQAPPGRGMRDTSGVGSRRYFVTGKKNNSIV